jgi:nitronate monooxygenase
MTTPAELTELLGIDVPLFCGPMFPCSNPELVAAASAAGALGVIQPISMTYVHGHNLREGIRMIRRLTDRPVGFNALVEQSSRVYQERMRKWVDVALEEGVRFFITALGKPHWVVDKVHAAGGIVFHDVPTRALAERALDSGVDGFICVNDQAGGHVGSQTPKRMMDELGDFGLPLICAGGVGDPDAFIQALKLGYAGVQMGTRFIATEECSAHDNYKRAILEARPEDIVHTKRISGIPCSVINTPHIKALGTEVGPLTGWMLRHRQLKKVARIGLQLRSARQLKRANLRGVDYKQVYQAGRSVDGVQAIEPTAAVVARFAEAYVTSQRP